MCDTNTHAHTHAHAYTRMHTHTYIHTHIHTHTTPHHTRTHTTLIPAYLQDGMGKLRVTDDGLRLEGRAEFIDPLYAQTITADQVEMKCRRILDSSANIYAHEIATHAHTGYFPAAAVTTERGRYIWKLFVPTQPEHPKHHHGNLPGLFIRWIRKLTLLSV